MDEVTKLFTEFERDALTPVVESLASQVKGVLDANHLQEFSVSGRPKDQFSILSNIIYGSKRLGQFFDLIGVRVVVRRPSEVRRAIELLRAAFTVVDQKDHYTRLGGDKVGYRSHHLVAEIPKDDPSISKGVFGSVPRFEIQVRSIFDHAWALQAHHAYKGSSIPADLVRKVNVASGLLEAAGQMLDEAETLAVVLSEQTAGNIKAGIFPTSIDLWTLEQYVRHSPTLSRLDTILKNDNFPDSWATVIVPQALETTLAFIEAGNIESFDDIEERFSSALDKVSTLGDALPFLRRGSGRSNYVCALLPCVYFDRQFADHEQLSNDRTNLTVAQSAGREILGGRTTGEL